MISDRELDATTERLIATSRTRAEMDADPRVCAATGEREYIMPTTITLGGNTFEVGANYISEIIKGRKTEVIINGKLVGYAHNLRETPTGCAFDFEELHP